MPGGQKMVEMQRSSGMPPLLRTRKSIMAVQSMLTDDLFKE